jgi:hypothetical protein
VRADRAVEDVPERATRGIWEKVDEHVVSAMIQPHGPITTTVSRRGLAA